MKIASSQIVDYRNCIYTQYYDDCCSQKGGFNELLGQRIARSRNIADETGSTVRIGEDFLAYSTSAVRTCPNTTNPVINPYDANGGFREVNPDNGLVTPERHKSNLNYEAIQGKTQEDVLYETATANLVSEGTVKTIDGRTIDFFYTMSLTKESRLMHEIFNNQNQDSEGCPLVISSGGKPPMLSDKEMNFDLDGDGVKENINLPGLGSGFLSLDLNGDGVINDGGELFGTSAVSGFEELKRYDQDNNMWIDENDEIFEKLTIWEMNDQGEMVLTTLKDAGVGAIYLNAESNPFDLWHTTSIALNENGTVSSVHAMDMRAGYSDEPLIDQVFADPANPPKSERVVQTTAAYRRTSVLKSFYNSVTAENTNPGPVPSSELKTKLSGVLEQYIYNSVNHYVNYQAEDIVFRSEIFDTVEQLWENNA